MSPILKGFLRGLGFALLTGGLTYIGDIAHLAGVSPYLATLISSCALAWEHDIESKGGGVLFGAFRG